MSREILEEWKSIDGYEGVYEISNKGRVRRLASSKFPGAGKYARPMHVLKPGTNNSGYELVELWRDGKKKGMLVHRLVAAAFVSNPNNYNIVNHKDENKHNNSFDNLERCTQKYNTNYGTRPQKIQKANGTPIVQLSENGTIIKTYPSINNASIENNVRWEKIRDCVEGKRDNAGGYVWKRAV